MKKWWSGFYYIIKQKPLQKMKVLFENGAHMGTNNEIKYVKNKIDLVLSNKIVFMILLTGHNSHFKCHWVLWWLNICFKIWFVWAKKESKFIPTYKQKKENL